MVLLGGSAPSGSAGYAEGVWKTMIKRVAVNESKLHCWQGGHGPDAVLIHGLTGNLAVWHFSIVSCLVKTHRVTTYDLRGHGFSSMPQTGYSSASMAEDLQVLFRKLGIERASVVGHSFGADIALNFALRYPALVERVVAVESGLPMLADERRRRAWPGWEEWAHVLEDVCGVAITADEWHALYTRLRAGESLDDIPGFRGHLPRKARHLLELLTTTTVVPDYEDAGDMTQEALATLACPVLLMYGAQSSYLGSLDVLARILPQRIAVVLPGCDHFGVLQQGDALSSPIRAFLSGHAVRPGLMEAVV